MERPGIELRRSWMSGWRSASLTSALILPVIPFGVPGGATIAYQATASKPGRLSAIVGTSGSDGSRWLEATASYAVQRSRDDSGLLQNSPQHLAKLRFAIPLSRRFDLSSGMQYDSSRLTLAQNTLKPLYLADFTLASKHLLANLDMRLGLRNAFNTKYSDPVSLFPMVDSMPQPGRTFFVELIAHQAR